MFDVVIVGARIAGSSLADLLGQLGLSVLVIDRDRLPSETLSSHYIGYHGVKRLAELGVLSAVEGTGIRRIERIRTVIGECLMEGPAEAPPGYALAPRRLDLDARLADHAAYQKTVRFAFHTELVGVLKDEQRITGVTVRHQDGRCEDIRARLVIGADGQNSRLRSLVDAVCLRYEKPLRPFYYAEVTGLVPQSSPTTELYFDEAAIGFVFPMEPGIDCLALELWPNAFASFRQDPGDALLRHFRSLSGMAQRLSAVKLKTKVMGTRGIAQSVYRPYGSGYVLVGDAGFCLDPSTGLGIGNALHQAFWLAEAISDGLAAGDLEQSLPAFHDRRDEALLPVYDVTLAYTTAEAPSPAASAHLQAFLQSPALARTLPALLINGVLPDDIKKRLTTAARAFTDI